MFDLAVFEQGFQYDGWATQRWIEFLGEDSEDRSIISHMLGAHMIWLVRCRGESLSELPRIPPTIAELNRIRDDWMEYLAANRHDPRIHFTRMDGQQRSLLVSEIVAHALNHGTYHRGELRGLCRARGVTDFPETDLALFYSGSILNP